MTDDDPTDSTDYIVHCECGFEESYETHDAASAAQAGHATGCKGPKTSIFTTESGGVPGWARTREGKAERLAEAGDSA